MISCATFAILLASGTGARAIPMFDFSDPSIPDSGTFSLTSQGVTATFSSTDPGFGPNFPVTNPNPLIVTNAGTSNTLDIVFSAELGYAGFTYGTDASSSFTIVMKDGGVTVASVTLTTQGTNGNYVGASSYVAGPSPTLPNFNELVISAPLAGAFNIASLGVSVAPEPSTWATVGLLGLGLTIAARRRRATAPARQR